jgi:biofilm protein TabA
MFGTIRDLVRLVHPESRLSRGLGLLWDCAHGRMPEITETLVRLEPGETRRFQLEAEDLYLLVQCYQPKPRHECRYEAHERHTDLQFIWSGGEAIEVIPLRAHHSSPCYDLKGNVHFALDVQVGSRLLLHAGDVAVLSPEDAHAPCLAIGDAADEPVRKIVVKITDAHLPDGGGANAFELAKGGDR